MASALTQQEKRDQRIIRLAIGVGVFVALGVCRNWSGWGGFFAGMLLVTVCGSIAALTATVVLSRRRKS